MENKKYLDKVVSHLVRGISIDYENNTIHFPYHPFYAPLSHISPFSSLNIYTFSTYCRNQFGLTDGEIKYVWKEYVEIIKDKIKNGE